MQQKYLARKPFLCPSPTSLNVCVTRLLGGALQRETVDVWTLFSSKVTSWWGSSDPPGLQFLEVMMRRPLRIGTQHICK